MPNRSGLGSTSPSDFGQVSAHLEIREPKIRFFSRYRRCSMHSPQGYLPDWSPKAQTDCSIHLITVMLQRSPVTGVPSQSSFNQTHTSRCWVMDAATQPTHQQSPHSLAPLDPVLHSAGLSLHPSALGHAARAIIRTGRVLQHEGPLQLFPLPFQVSSIPISSSMGQTPTEKMATPPRVMKKFLRLSPKALISKRGIQLCQRGGTVGQQELRQREVE